MFLNFKNSLEYQKKLCFNFFNFHLTIFGFKTLKNYKAFGNVLNLILYKDNDSNINI